MPAREKPLPKQAKPPEEEMALGEHEEAQAPHPTPRTARLQLFLESGGGRASDLRGSWLWTRVLEWPAWPAALRER